MKISNRKIITRILFGFIIIVTLSLTSIGFLIYELKYANDMSTELYNSFIITNNTLLTEINTYDIKNSLGDIVSELRLKDKSKANMYIVQVDGRNDSVKRHLEIVKENLKDESGKKILAEAEQLFSKWESTKVEIINLIDKENYAAAANTVTATKENIDELNKKLSDLDSQTGRAARNFHEKTAAATVKVIFVSIIISMILLSVSILITLFLSRSIALSLSLFREIFLKGSS